MIRQENLAAGGTAVRQEADRSPRPSLPNMLAIQGREFGARAEIPDVPLPVDAKAPGLRIDDEGDRDVQRNGACSSILQPADDQARVGFQGR